MSGDADSRRPSNGEGEKGDPRATLRSSTSELGVAPPSSEDDEATLVRRSFTTEAADNADPAPPAHRSAAAVLPRLDEGPEDNVPPPSEEVTQLHEAKPRAPVFPGSAEPGIAAPPGFGGASAPDVKPSAAKEKEPPPKDGRYVRIPAGVLAAGLLLLVVSISLVTYLLSRPATVPAGTAARASVEPPRAPSASASSAPEPAASTASSTTAPSANAPPVRRPPPPPIGTPAPVPRQPELAPWNPTAARKRLDQVSLRSCRREGGETGRGAATVTFSPAGAVVEIIIDPPYLGTKEGECVVEWLARTRIDPFEGPEERNVRHTFEVPD